MAKNQKDNWPTEIERFATFPRGKNKELRLSIMSFLNEEGRTIEYWSLRNYFKSSAGDWIPLNHPATIRSAEGIPLFKGPLLVLSRIPLQLICAASMKSATVLRRNITRLHELRMAITS